MVLDIVCRQERWRASPAGVRAARHRELRLKEFGGRLTSEEAAELAALKACSA